MPRPGTRLGRYNQNAQTLEVRGEMAETPVYATETRNNRVQTLRNCSCCGTEFDLWTEPNSYTGYEITACGGCAKLAFGWLFEMARRNILNRNTNGS